MARLSRKYKTLDFRIKPRAERKFDAISGWRWALDETYKQTGVNPNTIELLLTVYDFEFFSGHTIQKRFPVRGKYIFQKLKDLLEQGLLLKAFDEQEIEVSMTKGSGSSLHRHAESRMVRERYMLSHKAKKAVEYFTEELERQNGKLNSKDDIRRGEYYLRSDRLGIVKRDGEGDIAKPISDDFTVYFEEEDNVDDWYKEQGLEEDDWG